LPLVIFGALEIAVLKFSSVIHFETTWWHAHDAPSVVVQGRACEWGALRR
jgi:hypothetical protein